MYNHATPALLNACVTDMCNKATICYYREIVFTICVVLTIYYIVIHLVLGGE